MTTNRAGHDPSGMLGPNNEVDRALQQQPRSVANTYERGDDVHESTCVPAVVCAACRDTGYGPGRRPCYCPARPFGVNEPPAPRPALALLTAPKVIDQTELEMSTDRAMAWSSRHLSSLVGLAYWAPYLAVPQPSDIVAERVAHAVNELAAGADLLVAIITDLRRAAGLVATP